MENLKNTLAKLAFGRTRVAGQCVRCGKAVNPDTDFQDAISKSEYAITYTCLACQDELFTDLEDDDDEDEDED